LDRKLGRQPSPTPNSAGKSAKWQPLTSLAPAPDAEDNDPFSVGDSDDEKESKNKDLREEDSARLKEAARKSISSGSGNEKPTLQESERGSISNKDKDAEALLAGEKSDKT